MWQLAPTDSRLLDTVAVVSELLATELDSVGRLAVRFSSPTYPLDRAPSTTASTSSSCAPRTISTPGRCSLRLPNRWESGAENALARTHAVARKVAFRVLRPRRKVS